MTQLKVGLKVFVKDWKQHGIITSFAGDRYSVLLDDGSVTLVKQNEMTWEKKKKVKELGFSKKVKI